MFKNFDLVKNFVEKKIFETRILVIGDVMIDKYYYSEVSRISPEAPVPIAKVIREKNTLGGAANVAHNLARSGCDTHICGISGIDENRVLLLELLAEVKVDSASLITDKRPTTAKARIIGAHQQMLRLDFEDNTPISAKKTKEIIAAVVAKLDGFDGVVLSDYGKGVCVPGLCKKIIAECKKRSIPISVDPKGHYWQKYAGAYCITPNLKELSEVHAQAIKNTDDDVIVAGNEILEKFKLTNLLVTRSEKGMTLLNAEGGATIPTRAQEVFDVSGAGDTVISIFTAAVAGGICANDAAQLANLAAGVVVGKLGTYAISNSELQEAVQKNLKSEI
ncbi:MAG: D-glycero-beta-D-manno-heptose-7-phosphate kinase [Negativicutes bacterium]|jgi:D-beta-D-heptose 7-phosphate kinase/D-beta-D-heptose 1-phosphate adenosyltransferase